MVGATAATIIAGRAYVLIEAVDKTGRVLKAIGAALTKMRAHVPTLKKILDLINRISLKLMQIARQLDQIGGKMMGRGMRMIFGGMMAAYPVASAVRQYRDFSDAWLALRGVLGKSEDDMGRLKKKILDLGASTSYMSTEIAEAAEVLARGNFNINEIEASLESVLNLGRAGKVDLPSAANSMTKIIRAFRLEATDAKMVADQLFQASREGVADVPELMSALSFVAGTAENTNLKFSETVGVLAQLANNMLVGTKGGTAFNNMLLRMGTKADQVKEKLGIDVFDKDGALKEPMILLTEMISKIRQMPEEKRIDLVSIFNVRGQRAVNAMEQIEEIIEKIERIEASTDEGDGLGAAKVAADVMDSEIGGSIRKILSYFNNFAIAWGSTFVDPIMRFEKKLKPFLKNLGEWVKRHKELSKAVLKALVGILAFGVGLVALGLALKVAAFAFGTLATIISAGLFLAPLALKLVAILGYFELMTLLPGKIGDAFRALENTALKAFGEIWDIATKAFGAIAEFIMKGDVDAAMNVLVISLVSILDVGLANMKIAWVEFTSFIKIAMQEAAGGVHVIWNNMVGRVAKEILRLAELYGVANKVFKWFSGVDYQAEIARAKQLGNNPLMAEEIIDEETDKKNVDVVNERTKAIREINEARDAALRAAEEKIRKAKEAVDKSIAAGRAKSPWEDDEVTLEGEGKDVVPTSDAQRKSELASRGQVSGLEQGTLEATRKAHDNQQKMVNGINRVANHAGAIVGILRDSLPDTEMA